MESIDSDVGMFKGSKNEESSLGYGDDVGTLVESQVYTTQLFHVTPVIKGVFF